MFENLYIEVGHIGTDLQNNYSTDPNDQTVVVITQGRAYTELSGKTTFLEAGDALLLNRNMWGTLLSVSTTPLHGIVVDFKAAQVYYEKDQWRIETAVFPPRHIHKIDIFMVQNFEQLLTAGNQNQIIFGQYLLKKLLYKFHHQNEISSPNTDSHVIQQVVNYIKTSPQDPFEIEKWIKHCQMSKSVFYQKFREQTGYSPHQFVTQKRMEKAKQLLVQQNIRVQKVGILSGYGDAHYFSRIFKKSIGISPKHFADSFSKKVLLLLPAILGDLLALGFPLHNIIPNWNTKDQKLIYQHDKQKLSVQTQISQKAEWAIFDERTKDKLMKITNIQYTYPIYLYPSKSYIWKEGFLDLAKKMGVGEVAEHWLHDYEQKAAVLRETLQPLMAQKTVIGVRVLPHSFRVMGARRRKIAPLLYHDLGMTPPSSVRSLTFKDVETVEEINQMNAHVVLLFEGDQLSSKEIKQFNGEVYCLEKSPWFDVSAFGQKAALKQTASLLLSVYGEKCK
ncbi:AraC family transcriptional regulator [Salicibibacter cibarius]|uniref:AraC family transcriptional regulator n=1 Tax=Salicibibacter cibarius TaxID=2743000 RepID=A0A7T7CBQ1_9BACI|nr:AraC family transcriptional regulator [Salicibibacter cibarius]QQK76157.1 AraC family transcriptional regulator [Salicibibacter cibarius]